MINNIKYSFKTLFKNKMLVFWTFAFPIVLGLLFNFAFGGIEESTKLEVIDIAVVKTVKFNSNNYYKEVFEELSDSSSDNQLFNTKYVELEDAKKLLDDKKIVGYIIFDNENKVYINENGYKETVIKYVVDELSQSEKIITNIIEEKTKVNNDYQSIYMNAMSIIDESRGDSNTKDISKSKLSITVIEFYTLIAMACLYGAMFASTSLNQCLPNMSSNGKRMAISPTPKYMVVLSSVIASYITQLIGLFLLFIFLIFIVKLDFGNNLPLIVLLSLTGSLSGLAIGIFVSSFFKTNENNKTGIIIGYSMICSFFSGMMGMSMKNIVDKQVPIINRINPAAMITDGFYSLYYYDTLNRYWFNIISLLMFSIILILISMYSLRRQKYDSI